MNKKVVFPLVVVLVLLAASVACSGGQPATADAEVRPAPGGDASGAGAATQPDALVRYVLSDGDRSLSDLEGDAKATVSVTVSPSGDVEAGYEILVQVSSDDEVGISAVEATALVAQGMEILFVQRGDLFGPEVAMGSRDPAADKRSATVAFAREGPSVKGPFDGQVATFLVKSPAGVPDADTVFIKLFFADSGFNLHGEYAAEWPAS